MLVTIHAREITALKSIMPQNCDWANGFVFETKGLWVRFLIVTIDFQDPSKKKFVVV